MTLRELRENAVLRQEDAAKQLGVSVTTLSLWETGRHRPRASHIIKLAELYNLTPPEMKKIVDETMKQAS